jgi:hypothetical protein
MAFFNRAILYPVMLAASLTSCMSQTPEEDFVPRPVSAPAPSQQLSLQKLQGLCLAATARNFGTKPESLVPDQFMDTGNGNYQYNLKYGSKEAACFINTAGTIEAISMF